MLAMIDESVRDYETELYEKIETRDKLQTQIMNRWNAFHKAEENNHTRQYIKSLEDNQAYDLEQDTLLKSEKVRITELKAASTNQAEIDDYDFQLFLMQSEIDEIKERMDANAILITEEKGQYATRLEEQDLQAQIDALWTSFGEFEQAAQNQREIIQALRDERQLVPAANVTELEKIDAKIAAAQTVLEAARKTANEKYDALMEIE